MLGRDNVNVIFETNDVANKISLILILTLLDCNINFRFNKINTISLNFKTWLVR